MAGKDRSSGLVRHRGPEQALAGSVAVRQAVRGMEGIGRPRPGRNGMARLDEAWQASQRKGVWVRQGLDRQGRLGMAELGRVGPSWTARQACQG